jgi:tRNA(fMet)-specific endonuclease VapC
MELLRELAASEALLAVNAIAVAEIYSGLREQEADKARRLIAGFDFWVIEFNVAQLAGELRAQFQRMGRTLSLPDMMIAAHALSRGATVITDNLRDFPVADLKLLPVN